jgi:hypothetical protein
MLVAGETLNIFLLTGISNIIIVFIKKKNNVDVNKNIYVRFASKIVNKIVKKKIDITQTN